MTTVFGVFGNRVGIPYEDPGAEELISLHETRDGAEAARDVFFRENPYRYDSLSVVFVEVFP